MRLPLALLALALTSVTLVALDQGKGSEVPFREITREAGVTFQRHSAPEKKYIMESMSGGVALFDFDNDGLLDIYFVNSLTVETARNPRAGRSALYRNLGGGKFQDVTDKAGVGYPGWGMGVCTADLDGDGWEDLYVTALNGNTLYRNNGNGTFTNITKQAGVAVGGWSTGCGFADYDRDGHLDLFVSRYVAIDLNKLPPFGGPGGCQYRGITVQCGPRGLPGQADVLLRNDGKGRFTDVSKQAGLQTSRAHFGMGVAWFDANQDGWPDLYVANDTNPNFLYMNQKDGTFKEAGFAMGVAVSEDGAEQGGMGVAVGDTDNSGRFNLWVSNFAEEYNAFYANAGDHFTDVSFRSKSAASSVPHVGWGNAFFDYDNDGLLDKVVVNGHVYPQLDKAPSSGSASYRQRTLLYRNRGGTFEEVGARYGAVFTEERVGRGLAVGDLDNDGRLDIVINDLDGSPQILRNEMAGAGNWLLVRLKGRGMNTSAIGAVVTARTGGTTQRRLVQSGSSYLSQEDKRRHFGLGKAAQVDVLEVTWPDGKTTTMKDVKANQILDIEQPR